MTAHDRAHPAGNPATPPSPRARIAADAAAASPPAARVGRDLSCVSCGYNLRSLLADADCPECGTPIVRSLRGDELQFRDPRWLAALRWGALLLVMTELIDLYQLALPHVVVMLIPADLLGTPGRIGYAIGMVIFTAAALLLTQADPGRRDRDRLLRPLTRAAAVVLLAMSLTLTVAFFSGVEWSAWIGGVIVTMMLLSYIPMVGLLLIGRRLSLRMHRRRLANWMILLLIAALCTRTCWLAIYTLFTLDLALPASNVISSNIGLFQFLDGASDCCSFATTVLAMGIWIAFRTAITASWRRAREFADTAST